MRGIKANPAGGSVAVDDDGTEVVAEASRLNFGTGLDVTDDGSGQVTVTAAGGGGTSGSFSFDGGDATTGGTSSFDGGGA